MEKDLWRHLQQLSVDIGPRPNGSLGNQEAAAYWKSNVFVAEANNGWHAANKTSANKTRNKPPI